MTVKKRSGKRTGGVPNWLKSTDFVEAGPLAASKQSEERFHQQYNLDSQRFKPLVNPLSGGFGNKEARFLIVEKLLPKNPIDRYETLLLMRQVIPDVMREKQEQALKSKDSQKELMRISAINNDVNAKIDSELQRLSEKHRDIIKKYNSTHTGKPQQENPRTASLTKLVLQHLVRQLSSDGDRT